MDGEIILNTQPDNDQATPAPTFGEALAYWIKLGFISFGGPAGQIAIMQTDCVDRRRWIDQGAFLRGLNYCMLLPGPEAQQLAAYIGWRLHGVKGALAAGLCFIIPGLLLMIGLAWLAAAHGDHTLVRAVFAGIKPVVVAIIVHAVWRIGRKACDTVAAVALAAFALFAIRVLEVPFPFLVLGAGALGALLPGLTWQKSGGDHDAPASSGTATVPSGIGRVFVLVAVFALLWVVVVAATVSLLGGDPFTDVAQLFTTAAFVTFGGAYAVLPYIADAGVNVHGWLSAGDMMNGLALAETTPGPLIMVTTYVGFFAGWNGPAGMTGAIGGIWAALLTTYVTFLPSFLFIIAGAPYVERLQSIAWARRALQAVTAAVVGVILNLAFFFGEGVFLPPSGVDPVAIAVAVVSLGLLMGTRIQLPALVGLGALWGLLHTLVLA